MKSKEDEQTAESDALKKIDHLSHSKGIWGEMNTLNVSNMWLGK